MTLNRTMNSAVAILGTSGLLLALSPVAAASDEWEFSLSPLFLWGLSLEGDAAINGNVAPLDLEFKDDLLENMEAVFTLHFEARRGNWTFFSEYQLVDLEPGVEAQLGPVDVDADISFREDLFELGAGWTFSQSEYTRWELLGGARYTDQEITVDLTLDGGLAGPGIKQKLKGGDDWWHGFAGLRVQHALSEHWSFIGRADYGYGGSDNTAGNVAFMFDYRFRDWGSAFFGGRYLTYDYDESAYGFDATKAGPLAGITIHW